jgi:beta-glucosidase
MADSHPFQNPELPTEARIDDLIGRMTLAEKLECLSTNPSVPRLGVVGSGHVEGLHGLALGAPGGWGGEEPIPTTTFPQAYGLGETWDPELVRAVADLEGRECRYVFHTSGGKRGGLVVRAPNADLGRDPRWGRTEECFGEDAYFNGVMTQAFVHGLQGDHPRYWRTASLMKHFLANSNEVGRERGCSSFDERMFREYYSVPFRKGIEAGSRAFMAAYNKVNGIPCSVHPMLSDVARGEWGQDGIICTDGGAFTHLVTEHHYFERLPDAAGPILRAGINQFLDKYRVPVETALAEGLLTEADIDHAIRPNFRVMIRLGLLDPPELVPHTALPERPPWEEPASRALVRRVTAQSAVLLKNDGALLPLEPKALRSLALLGERSNEVLFDWYSGGPPYSVSPLDGLRAKLGDSVEVRHAKGGPEALALARTSDVVVLCVGNHPTGNGPFGRSAHPSYGKESVDRIDLELPDEPFIRQVVAANPRTVVVLIASFPYGIAATHLCAPAILKLTHSSQELGHGLADVLFGDVNPGGRLVQTWLHSVDDLPPMLDYDLRLGRAYLYYEGTPLYPFGYGLSYTTFAYSNLRSGGAAVSASSALEVSVDVTNTGKRAGDDVVQLYARYPKSLVKRPQKQLVGFRRVRLDPGETKTVTLTFDPSEVATWDVAKHAFVLEPGRIELQIAKSARDVVLTTEVRVG